jgi:hypothetical protein
MRRMFLSVMGNHLQTTPKGGLEVPQQFGPEISAYFSLGALLTYKLSANLRHSVYILTVLSGMNFNKKLKS